MVLLELLTRAALVAVVLMTQLQPMAVQVVLES
jgi:hypothetical protein